MELFDTDRRYYRELKMDIQRTKKKENDLKNYLKSLGSAAIAFSGGVDSAYLLKIAHDVLGDNCIAVTARAVSFPEREIREAEEFCRAEKIKHFFADTDQLKIEGFAQNTTNRCYFCKKGLLAEIKKIAFENGMKYVAEGSNTDDDGDHRPGRKAVEEHGVKSPLKYADLNKEEIRFLSRRLGLPTSDKPSFACLSTRIAYGENITAEKLLRAEKAERFLTELGCTQVRVRIHGDLARIEVLPCEFEIIYEYSEKIYKYFKSIGFVYVSLDLQGYRTGSMNENADI